MSHKAIIAKIDKVYPIPGADSIQVGVVLGEQVIINKATFEGTVGVLFPADLQLSEEYCHHNSLFRHAEKNKDNTKTGFFDDNRKVRVQPFMKVKSQAYFAPLDSLDYTQADMTKLTLGVQFDELNGKKICQKYISEETRKRIAGQNRPKQASANLTPFFEKHVDSEQFKHYSHLIPAGSLLSFHSKRHGCFKAQEKVLMWDGSMKAISKIEAEDVVVGVDSEGNVTSSVVKKVFTTGLTKDWLEVRISRKGFLGNRYSTVECTPDHWFAVKGVDETLHWKEAQHLTNEDSVMYAFPARKPSTTQLEALLGKFLGDGSFSASGNMQYAHKAEHLPYLMYCQHLFSDLSVDRIDTRISGFGTEMKRAMVKSSPHISNYFRDCQIKGKGKVLKPWMVDVASPLTLALWYLDDGCLAHSDVQADRASFAVCRYDEESLEVAKNILKKFGINVVQHSKSDGRHPRFRLNTADAYTLFNLIAQHVPSSMAYKLPEELRYLATAETSTVATESTWKPCLTLQKLVGLRKIGGKKAVMKWDMETTTANFLVHGCVVHNSSFRTSLTPVKKELPKWKQWINKYLPMFPEEEYQLVTGSRNVVLQTKGKDGHHGSEQFRFDVSETLRPYLSKGMTIYGEICGYVNGKPIMAVHNSKCLKDKAFTKKYGENIVYKYGCKEHEYVFHIYRITQLSTDGVNIDFTQAQLEDWCKKRNLMHTIDVHPPVVYNGDVEKLKALVEQLTERSDNMCEDVSDPSHPSEGIIIRADGAGFTPKFYKSKSFYFRAMESGDDTLDREAL